LTEIEKLKQKLEKATQEAIASKSGALQAESKQKEINLRSNLIKLGQANAKLEREKRMLEQKTVFYEICFKVLSWIVGTART
jgi:hypothetical protein